MSKTTDMDILCQNIRKAVSEYDARFTYSKEQFIDDLFRLAVEHRKTQN